MHVTAIIAAGGRGQRFGGERLKQLLSVGGRPILERSVTAFLGHADVDEVVVALPPDVVADPPAYLRSAEAFALQGSGKPLRLVAGGERRQDSVANAFRAAAAESDIIVIHDAARPFASADLIARTIAAAAETGAAVAALGARDTVKQGELVLRQAQDEREKTTLTLSSSKGERDAWLVKETLPRETIFLAQTPQAFRRDVLQAALALGQRDGIDATDEAALVERGGHEVRLVAGEASNIKITTPEDLPIAEAIADGLRNADRGLRNPDGSRGENQAASRKPQSAIPQSAIPRAAPARTGRAGTGYDLHRLVAGRPLVLGGVTIPSDRGALGHSDADVVCHAVTDAILGAVCLGDIGRHFPDSEPRWKDASSLDLLRRVVQLVSEQGFMVGNVDVTVILETPKIRDHVDAMRASVAGAIGIDVARVSIKGKTNEGVDAIGRGEAIAAHAIALLRSLSR
jgi:2-C-methyl-D-erythritol 4-phosphate cytidylyltransferase / 2-C-methyl-D-erythritol 2,4-cyclodiphosphate synthase